MEYLNTKGLADVAVSILEGMERLSVYQKADVVSILNRLVEMEVHQLQRSDNSKKIAAK